MMSVERSFEAWEEVQRQGLDLADRLAQGFTGLIQINPPSFPWPHHHQKSKPFDLEFPIQHFDAIRDYSFGIINQPINGVAAVLDVGSKIGQAGVDFGSGLNLMVQQFFRRLPVPFMQDDIKLSGKSIRSHRAYVDTKDDLGLAAERLKDSGFSKKDDSVTMSEEEVADSYLRTGGFLGRSKVYCLLCSLCLLLDLVTVDFLGQCRERLICHQVMIVEQTVWNIHWQPGETYGDLKPRVRVLLQVMELRLSFFSSLDRFFSYAIRLFFYRYTYQNNTCSGMDMTGRYMLN